jgi:hypothetical protein
VVGRATDLEYTLRAATKVTEKGPFRDAVLARIRDTTIKMDEALKAVPIAEYKAVLDAVPRSDTGALKIAGAKELLESLPPKLAAASEEFVKKHDGTDLAAIDPLLPAPTAYKGESHP